MFGLHMFNEMEKLQREMDQIFSQRAPRGQVRRQHQGGSFRMREEGDAFIVEAALPGVDSEQLEISVLDRQLCLKGAFAGPELPEDATWHRRERPSGRFEQHLSLPVAVDPEKVEAEYRRGLLRLTLPKAESARPKKITVKSA